MAPPEMPAALYARQVDAYATGEPFGAVAEVAGYARILYMTRDKWPSSRLLRAHRAPGSDRSRAPAGAADRESRAVRGRLARDRAGQPRPRRRHRGAPGVFNQRADILKHVLTNPRDRVTYADLRLIRSELDELMEAALEAGIIKQRIAYERYVDESFQRSARPVEIHVQR